MISLADAAGFPVSPRQHKLHQIDDDFAEEFRR